MHLSEQFLLRRDITFLNHGSFGACPRPVFETYQQWQRTLEMQPVEFLGRRLNGLLAEARARLAAFIGAAPDDVVFVPNVTYAMNIVARSIDLRPGDEVLGSNHEYGAVGASGGDVGSAAGGGGAPPHAVSSIAKAVARRMVMKKRMVCIIEN